MSFIFKIIYLIIFSCISEDTHNEEPIVKKDDKKKITTQHILEINNKIQQWKNKIKKLLGNCTLDVLINFATFLLLISQGYYAIGVAI